MVVNITNLSTGISCECSNLDVIRECKKDPNYKVVEIKEKPVEKEEENPKEEEKPKEKEKPKGTKKK